MKHEDYLITLERGTKNKKFVWHSHEMAPIDCGQWYLKRTSMGGIQIIHKSIALQDEHKAANTPPPSNTLRGRLDPHNIAVNPEILIYGSKLAVPIDPDQRDSKKFKISIQLLKPIPAAYLPRKDSTSAHGAPPALSSSRDVFYLFGGVRYYFNELQKFNGSYSGKINSMKLFTLSKTNQNFQIVSQKDHVALKIHGEPKKTLKPGEVFLISEEKLSQTTIQYGKYWWRIGRIHTPEPLSQNELADLVDEKTAEDQTWLKGISRGIFLIALSFGLLIQHLPHPPETVKQAVTVDLTKISLKQPKIIPKKAISPPPKAIPTPKPTPKPKPKATPPPKKKPPKVVQPKKPQTPPKKIREPVKRPVQPPKKPQPPAQAPPRAKVNPPPKSVQRTQSVQTAKPVQPVQQKAQAQADLAKSLTFLSPSHNRAQAPKISHPDGTSRNYASNDLPLTSRTKNSTFNKLESNSNSEGPILTQSSRGLHDLASGGIKRKGLNEVQGRVTLASNGNPENMQSDLEGSAGTPGVAIRGSGQLSEKALEKALSQYQSKLQYCYEKALLTDSSLSGTMLMQWTINENGSVAGVKVVRTPMHQPQLNQCISNVIKSITFPRPVGGSVTVNYPFSFAASSL